MTTERVASIVLLIGCIYGGVWAALEKPSLIGIFFFLIVISAWTYLAVSDAAQMFDGEEG